MIRNFIHNQRTFLELHHQWVELKEQAWYKATQNVLSFVKIGLSDFDARLDVQKFCIKVY